MLSFKKLDSHLGDIEEHFRNQEAVIEALQMMVKDQQAMLKRCLKMMPVAAEVAPFNMNRVEYTKREWDRIVKLTADLKFDLGVK